ncbi:growth arrest-specific protein 8 [Kipferlia bialata]|uniref:Growth arrest-specific protein 8 n=1 Tax=Kipferlia bialata TaxID=797122 RepID=A0A9K3GMX7_9EUKA|nr:growth arrest-specific protein 8 [Kipferlia bialata]|eukprot:g10418.t1
MAPPKKGPKKTSRAPSRADGEQGGAAAAGGADLAGKVTELEGSLTQVKAQLKKEEEERNYYQLERDKLFQFYEVTKQRLEESDTATRNKDREIEELIEKHQVAIKVYQQKIKDLLYEHRRENTELRTENERSLKAEEDFHNAREEELRRERRALKLKLRETENAHQDLVQNLQEEHLRSMSLLRRSFEEQLGVAQTDYEHKLHRYREDAEIRRRAEVHEVDERKNQHIRQLIAQHERAFAEIKAYYNDITHSSLDLIKSLKEELAEVRLQEAASQKLMFEIAQENRQLTEPLEKALSEVGALRRQLLDHDRDRLSLDQAQGRYRWWCICVGDVYTLCV